MLNSIGLLTLRVILATFMFSHGWAKLSAYSELASTFPDPIGVGSRAALSLAIFAEVFCSALLLVGLFTRYAAVPLLITMLVAGLLVHGADPFAKKELAFLYAAGYVTIMCLGAGGFSLDAVIRRKR